MNRGPLDSWQFDHRQLDYRHLDYRPLEGLSWRLRAWIARWCNRCGGWRDGRRSSRCSARCRDRCGFWRKNRRGDWFRAGDSRRHDFSESGRDNGRARFSQNVGYRIRNNCRNRFRNRGRSRCMNSFTKRFRNKCRSASRNCGRYRFWRTLTNRFRNGFKNRCANRFTNRFSNRISNRLRNRLRNHRRNRFWNKLRNVVREGDRRGSRGGNRHSDSCRFLYNISHSARSRSPNTRPDDRQFALRPAQRPAAERHSHPLQKDQVARFAPKALAAKKNLVRSKPRDAVRDSPAPRALGGIPPGSNRRCLCHTGWVPDRLVSKQISNCVRGLNNYFAAF